MTTSSVFDSIAYSDNKTFERSPLAIGKFGTGAEPGLKIVKTISPKAHPFLPDTIQYSYLVAATDEANTGTAFLTIEVGKYTLTPAAVAIAFEKTAEMVASGEVGTDDIAFLQQALLEEATNSVNERHVKEANATETNPVEATQEEIDGKLQNLTINLQRNLRNLLALQAWAGHTPGVEGVDFGGFDGVKFSGSTKANYNQTGTDVKTVFTKSRPKA